MNDQVAGIILKQTDYKDNAVILSVLTKEYGKISFIASGVKKMTSKNAGSTMPYMLSEFTFDYKDNKTIFRMKTARTIQLWRFLHEDLTASCASAVICELADVLTMNDGEYEFAQIVYEETELALSLLNQKKNPSLIVALFLSTMLEETGIQPEVDQCVLCGKSNAATISARDGGFICNECASKMHMQSMPLDLLRDFRIICKASLDNFDVVSKHVKKPYEVLNILVQFLGIHSGVQLRSYPLFQRFCSVD